MQFSPFFTSCCCVDKIAVDFSQYVYNMLMIFLASMSLESFYIISCDIQLDDKETRQHRGKHNKLAAIRDCLGQMLNSCPCFIVQASLLLMMNVLALKSLSNFQGSRCIDKILHQGLAVMQGECFSAVPPGNPRLVWF